MISTRVTLIRTFWCYEMFLLYASLPEFLVLHIVVIAWQASFTDDRNSNRKMHWVTGFCQRFLFKFKYLKSFFFQALKIYVILEVCIRFCCGWLEVWMFLAEQCQFPFSANFTKWSNTLKQFVGKLPTSCLNVFDHFVGFAMKGLSCS